MTGAGTVCESRSHNENVNSTSPKTAWNSSNQRGIESQRELPSVKNSRQVKYATLTVSASSADARTTITRARDSCSGWITAVLVKGSELPEDEGLVTAASMQRRWCVAEHVRIRPTSRRFVRSLTAWVRTVRFRAGAQ